MKAAKGRVLLDETMKVKWYWPPADGNADASSARPAAAHEHSVSQVKSNLERVPTDKRASNSSNQKTPNYSRPAPSKQWRDESCRIADPRICDAESYCKEGERGELAWQLSFVSLATELKLICGETWIGIHSIRGSLTGVYFRVVARAHLLDFDSTGSW